MDIRRKPLLDVENVYVIDTSGVLSPDRTWPDRWLNGTRMRGEGFAFECPYKHPSWSPVSIGKPAREIHQ